MDEAQQGLAATKKELLAVYRNTELSAAGNSFKKEQVAELNDLLVAYQNLINELNNVQDASVTSPFVIG